MAGQGFSGNFGLDVQKFYVAYYDASDVFIERTGLLQTYRDIEVKPEFAYNAEVGILKYFNNKITSY